MSKEKKNTRIGKRNAWHCSCGAETWALQQSERDHLVAEHAKPSGEPCEKSKTVQQEGPVVFW